MSHGVGLPNALRAAHQLPIRPSPTPVMLRLPESLGKLKGKSLDELRVRGAQAMRARLERLGLSNDIREPSDQAFRRLFDCRDIARDSVLGDELLRRFREEDYELAQQLPGLRSLARTADAFRARCPRSAAATVAAAEQILAGVVRLGDHLVSFGTRPDWTLEHVSGKRAPRIHWSRIAFLDPQVAGDCKFTWELNRHQYFVTLGQAYVLTGDDRYASCIADHLSSWMDENPPKIGINWTSSLELALRSISWIWALSLVRHSPRLKGELYVRALKFLYAQGRHIEQNLSTFFSPNTHLTGEALGLVYIGTALPSFELAQHWRELGTRILAEQLDRQLFPDGVYFEQSTYYHRYTTDFYLHAALLTSNSAIHAKLHLLVDYLLHITRPNGTSPFIGDDDGGRLVMLAARQSNDFRDTLAIGAAVLQRGDCALVAGESVDELPWLLGPRGLEIYDGLTAVTPASTSRAFRDSGYFVMRESWNDTADWALIRCGPHASRFGAHAHADALAVELAIGGHSMFVDPGTYVYTASRAERDYFRSSAAHNTLTLDGRSSAEPAVSAFKWTSVPSSRATAWVTHEMFDLFVGEHDGFRHLESPAVHSRTIFFLKGEYWVTCDRVRSQGPHHIALYWHWAPGIELSNDSADGFTAVSLDADGAEVSARLFARGGQISRQRAWTSTAYGTRTPSQVTVVRLDSKDTEEIVTLLAKSSAVRFQDGSWRALSGCEAGVLTVATASMCDTIVTGSTSDECDGLITDGTWTWVRRSLAGEPLAFAIINGRRLSIDDRSTFQSDSVVDWAVGQRHADGWCVEVHVGGRQPTTSLIAADHKESSCVVSVE